MRRIFFFVHSMNVGGVEQALLGLLSVLPLDQWEIHVGMTHRRGGFLNLLPKAVKVHEIDCFSNYWRQINDPPMLIVKQNLKEGNFIGAFIHLFFYVHFKLTSSRYLFYKYITRHDKGLNINFDLAVAFAGPSSLIDYYVCEMITAKRKCGWIHFDVSKFGFDKKMTAQLYKKYNKIFIVSETGKVIFDKLFPHFSSKTEVFHNIISQKQVVKLAETGPTFLDEFRGKRILTVGRISEEKGQRVAIEALHKLLNKGYQIRWYFVGDGKDLEYCKKLSRELNTIKEVFFLGTQINPYGFMKDCDIYVQPSRHEGFCITLTEALCFGHPIVATDFTGAKEQLRNRSNGIVTGMSVEDIVSGL